jgi:chemotaxis protein methyltransferase CheR
MMTYGADAYLDLSEREALNFIALIHAHSGIKLDLDKKALITSRLLKRLRALGLESLRHYFDYLQTAEGQRDELGPMIDEITTNKTSFFRERHHFDYLEQSYLPDLLRRLRFAWKIDLNIWSAGCSTGEEAYSMAMVLAEFCEKAGGGKFAIVGTDISTRALLRARQAVYPEALLEPVPAVYRDKYMMRGKGKQAGNYRVVPELRDAATFEYMNFVDDHWDVPDKLDIIFCRNVMIYFDRPTRQRIVRRFYDHLTVDGLLFIGHSETLSDIDHRFAQVMPTVYQRTAMERRNPQRYGRRAGDA